MWQGSRQGSRLEVRQSRTAWGSLVEGSRARQGKLAATQLRKFRPSGKQGAAVRQRHKEYWVVVEAVVLL